ncbi:MAG: hypothetical protein M1830_010182 [Pleopsidium flavum]|nr:MAG: hypothetical protein M1830_010182 [Pleopsidium flavum]
MWGPSLATIPGILKSCAEGWDCAVEYARRGHLLESVSVGAYLAHLLTRRSDGYVVHTDIDGERFVIEEDLRGISDDDVDSILQGKMSVKEVLDADKENARIILQPVTPKSSKSTGKGKAGDTEAQPAPEKASSSEGSEDEATDDDSDTFYDKDSHSYNEADLKGLDNEGVDLLMQDKISFAQVVAGDYQREGGVTAEALALAHAQIAREKAINNRGGKVVIGDDGITRGRIIKYLSKECKFWYTRDTVRIPDALDNLSPKRLVLPQSNPDIIKIAVGICKDTTRNKMYIKEKVLPKPRVGSIAYAVIHDKKERTKGKKKGRKTCGIT